MKPNRGVPNMAALNKYRVNRPNQKEGIRQTMYDFTSYAAAGQTLLQFFAVPYGQSSKTEADTNMSLGGQLPAGQSFLCHSVEILFWPGVNPDTYATTPAAPFFANDVYTFAKSGWLEFKIGSKLYVQEAPLGRFPAKTRLEGHASHAVESTATTVTYQLSTAYAAMGGRPYHMDPPVLLEAGQNFSVNMKWGSAVALPSNTAARVGIILDGILYRNSQ